MWVFVATYVALNWTWRQIEKKKAIKTIKRRYLKISHLKALRFSRFVAELRYYVGRDGFPAWTSRWFRTVSMNNDCYLGQGWHLLHTDYYRFVSPHFKLKMVKSIREHFTSDVSQTQSHFSLTNPLSCLTHLTRLTLIKNGLAFKYVNVTLLRNVTSSLNTKMDWNSSKETCLMKCHD